MQYGEQLLQIEDKLDKQADIMRDQIRVREEDKVDSLLARLDRRVDSVRRSIDHAYDDPMPQTVQIATDMVDMFSVLSIEQMFSTMRKDSRDHHKKRANEQERAARTDSLTQSNNRSVYHEQIKAATNKIASDSPDENGKKHYFALVMFDLDRFKGINDDYGHDTGDAALQTFADKIKSVTRTHEDRRAEGDRPEKTDRRLESNNMDSLFLPFGRSGENGGEKSMSRLGGDEFTLLMNTKAESLEEATIEFQAGLARIRGELETLYVEHKGMSFPIVSSSGMHILEQDDTVDSAYVEADTALAEHKKDKKERYEKTVERLREMGINNLQVVEDKRKTELSAMKVEDVVIALNTLQERGALTVHIRPDQELTNAAEILEELGVTVVYDDDPEDPVPSEEVTPV